MCSSRNKSNISVTTVYLNCYFKVIDINKLYCLYFSEGYELNIAFPFVILMSQDYGREANSITVFEKFSQYREQKLTILLTSCSKRLRICNWDTILESH